MPRAPQMQALERGEAPWAALFLLFPLILAWLDAGLLHPGFGSIDETAALRQAWELPSRGLEATLFSGALGRLLLAPILHFLPPSLLSPLALPAAAWFLENILLAALAQKLVSRQAALGALAFNSVAALTLVRLRTPFSWSLVPLECAAVLGLLVLLEKRPLLRSLGAGLLLGLLWLDYEAIAAFSLGLLLALPWLRKRATFSSAGFLLGLALGLGLVAWLSRETFESYLLLRRNFTVNPDWTGASKGANLLAFLFGGRTALPGLGLMHWSSVPLWGVVLLALGLKPAWDRQRWLLLLALAGLLPLLLPAASLPESNRGAAAWLPLCLAAGLGLERLKEGSWGRPLFLWGLISAGAAAEGAAFFRSQSILAPEHYASLQATAKAARELRPSLGSGEAVLLSNLGYQRASEMEWLSRPGPRAGDKVLALVPAAALAALGDHAGTWRVFEGRGKLHAYVLEPKEPLAGRLVEIDEELGRIHARLSTRNHLGNLEFLKAALDQSPQADPWVRTVLWQKRMTLAVILGRCDAALVDELLKERLLHSGPLRHPSLYLEKSNPELAARLKAALASFKPARLP